MKSLEELMEIAQSPGNAPEDLEKKIGEALEAAAYLKDARRNRRKAWEWGGVAMATVAAALAIVLTVNKNQPVDTFTDPEEAYIQVQYALNLISSKMAKGIEMAQAPITEVGQFLEKYQ